MNEEFAPQLPQKEVKARKRRPRQKKTFVSPDAAGNRLETQPIINEIPSPEPPVVELPVKVDKTPAEINIPAEPDGHHQAPARWWIVVLAGIVLLAVVLVIYNATEAPPAGPTTNNVSQDKLNQTELGKKLAAQSQINKFEDYGELKEFLENNQTGLAPNYQYYEALPMDAGIAEKSVDSSNAPAPGLSSAVPEGRGGGSDDYSTTNVQVEGVDEADIIKTDGKYVYAVTNKNLFIVDAYPANGASVLSKIEFKDQPQDIFISGDRLVIFGNDYEINSTDMYKSFRRHSQYTFLKIFDISDRKNPKEVRDIDIEGSYNNSRMIGDYVYFITSTYSYYYYEDEIPVPRILDGGKEIYDSKGTDKCAKCPDVYYFNMPYESFNFTNIAAINVKDESKDIKSEVYMLASNQNLFVSQDNIYITYTKYISEYQLSTEVAKEVVFPRLSDRDKERVKKIEEADKFVLSETEKSNKIAVIIENYRHSLSDDELKALEEEVQEKLRKKYEDISKELEKTVIHKIAIDKDSIEYKTHGEVTGHVLNQFSMDEHNGYFRIATTKNRTWMNMGWDSRQRPDRQQESYSNIYVLDKDLKQVGAVEGLAKGEQIYSARFMGGRAYLVTFVQTDPLFVIDLEDPKQPKVLGELKVPGFSNYLHPYDENTLIGIGKEVDDNLFSGVRTLGVKLSLFDVSDVSEPREIDKYVFNSGTDSIALHEHKAFLFSKDKNLLVIPITNNQGWGQPIPLDDRVDMELRVQGPSSWFNGAAVFHVGKEGFELKGMIDHSDGKAGKKETYCGYYCYDNTVQRSLYIDDTLYTFSNRYLQANEIDGLEDIRRVELKKGEEDYKIVN